VDIRILETPDVGREVARRVAAALRRTPGLVLGLPTGRTPLDVYAELRRLYAAREVDFSHATVFLIDEFVGLADFDSSSFRHQLGEQLLSKVNFDLGRIHALDGLVDDHAAECRRYDDAIVAAGGLGLLLLGIGANGHIGFNEPGETLVSRTHRETLHDSTRRDNAGLFGGNLRRVPTEALSMGMGMLRAETILLIATGQHKAAVVERMIRGPLSTQLPASFLQLHRQVEVYLDRAAASAL
jgi:glucosamine-6-phosphate deaminase